MSHNKIFQPGNLLEWCKNVVLNQSLNVPPPIQPLTSRLNRQPCQHVPPETTCLCIHRSSMVVTGYFSGCTHWFIFLFCLSTTVTCLFPPRVSSCFQLKIFSDFDRKYYSILIIDGIRTSLMITTNDYTV